MEYLSHRSRLQCSGPGTHSPAGVGRGFTFTKAPPPPAAMDKHIPTAKPAAPSPLKCGIQFRGDFAKGHRPLPHVLPSPLPNVLHCQALCQTCRQGSSQTGLCFVFGLQDRGGGGIGQKKSLCTYNGPLIFGAPFKTTFSPEENSLKERLLDHA